MHACRPPPPQPPPLQSIARRVHRGATRGNDLPYCLTLAHCATHISLSVNICIYTLLSPTAGLGHRQISSICVPGRFVHVSLPASRAFQRVLSTKCCGAVSRKWGVRRQWCRTCFCSQLRAELSLSWRSRSRCISSGARRQQWGRCAWYVFGKSNIAAKRRECATRETRRRKL